MRNNGYSHRATLTWTWTGLGGLGWLGQAMHWLTG